MGFRFHSVSYVLCVHACAHSYVCYTIGFGTLVLSAGSLYYNACEDDYMYVNTPFLTTTVRTYIYIYACEKRKHLNCHLLPSCL